VGNGAGVPRIDEQISANAAVHASIREDLNAARALQNYLVDLVVTSDRTGAAAMASEGVHAQTSAEELVRCLSEARQASEQLALRMTLIKTK
jgi:hypothetical protein